MIASVLLLGQLAAATVPAAVPTPVAPLRLQLRSTVIAGCEGTPSLASRGARDANGARRLQAEAQEAVLQGDRANARALLERAIALDPLEERLALELARLQEELGDRTAALATSCRASGANIAVRTRDEVLARVARLAPPSRVAAQRDAEARFASGLAAARQRQWRVALGAFTDVTRLQPLAPEGHFNRAVMLVLTGDRPEAIRAFERYLELAPDAPDRVQVARAFSTLRRPVYSPGGALVSGFVPGGAQFATGRPAAGVLVLGLAAGAVVYGVLPQERQRTIEYIDPNGQPVPYTETYTTRPYLGPAIAAAAVLTVAAAWEGFATARRSAGPVRLSVTPLVAPAPGVRWAVRVAF